jgi:hypothetical protein
VGGGYGFAEITRYGAEIESAARAGDGTAVACAAGALRTYLEALDVEYV